MTLKERKFVKISIRKVTKTEKFPKISIRETRQSVIHEN